ncbi:hypothetical protein GOODEAATRI_018511 [Goodea atripinnis]|uniref:Integrase zinc-binding domain-containing protein n=1 Tax=Goodea atripinnis TaxID=208336 RepID=A0ABV0P5W4_9TELE
MKTFAKDSQEPTLMGAPSFMKVDHKLVWASSGLDTMPLNQTTTNWGRKQVSRQRSQQYSSPSSRLVPWLPPSQTHAICAITRRQTREGCEDPQGSGETLHLGRKPNDTDLATMQDQDPDLHTIRELVASGLLVEALPLAMGETKELRTLRRNLSHPKLEKGLLVYTHNGHGMPRWVVPTDHRGVMLAYTHDSPVGGHRGFKATLHTLQQVAYWPSMAHNTQVYIQDV